MFKKPALVLMILSLPGCWIAPGMTMDSPPDAVKTEASKFTITPTFIAITPELITRMPESQNDKYYFVGPQDVLSITVWGHPEFTTSGDNAVSTQSVNTSSVAPQGFLVNADGAIYFPLVGYINVANKTADQIRSQMATALSKYVHTPIVDIRISGYRSHRVYVMGEVAKAGLINLNDVPLNITDAINLAGGFNQDMADTSHIYVIRGNMAKPTVYWLNAGSVDALLMGQKFHLEDNDIIFVSTADVARWNRAINQIMPTIQTVFYTQAVTKT